MSSRLGFLIIGICFVIIDICFVIIGVFFVGIIISETNNTTTLEETALVVLGETKNPTMEYNSQVSNIPTITTTSVQKVGEINMGMVSVKINDKGKPVLVLVAPYHEITIGSEIKVLAMSYRNHVDLPVHFLVMSN